jgi:hypothetical protein
MSRIDLDAVEARAKAALADNWCNTPVCSVAPGAHPRQAGCPGTVQQWEHYRRMDPPTVLALAAELRAARAAHDELRDLYADLGANDATAAPAYRLRRILEAWEVDL